MRWSYTLGRFFGIAIRVHVTFGLLLAWVAISTLASGGGLVAMLASTFFVLALFSFVVMHEYGHALTARAFGIRTREITLYPIGGMAMLEGMPKSPGAQLLVALAGPAVNFVLAGFIAVLAALTGGSVLGAGVSIAGGSLLASMFWVNVVMGVFNLLPALPMDGGRVLKALLTMRLGEVRATAVAARVARVIAVLMGLYGLLIGNPFLVAIALMVWFLAGAEQRMAELQAQPSAVHRAEPFYAADPRVGVRHPGHESLKVQVGQGPDGPRLRLVRLTPRS